jgi:hypothetical protein
MKPLIAASTLLAAILLEAPSLAQAGDVYQVCHGESTSVCAQHPYDYHETCGVQGGMDPRQTTIFLCGAKRGGVPKGTWKGTAPGIDGGNCGYAWVEVTCDDD